MTHDTLIVDVADKVALIRLNRPEALNALNQQMMTELVAVLQDADRDPAVRCIVLTGSERAFAAGADIRAMAGMDFVDVAQCDLFGPEAEAILRIRKPIIAAVAGYALGGGCELAMTCDIIICADSAKFGQPEITLGLCAGLGGTQRMTRAIGKAKSMDMHLTGRLMDAAEAERSGLVARVVPADRLLDEAMALAQAIAGKSMLSVMAVKEAVNRSQEMPLHEGLLFERRLFQSLFATTDRSEGMAAFLEKRSPRFQDR